MGISKQVTINGKIRRVGNYAHVRKFRLNKKVKLIEAFGGKCVICGYDKSLRSLTFHHIDPATKKFGLSSGGLGRSFEENLEEAKKCILVCANCHGEIHDGLVDAKLYAFAPSS